MKFVEPGSHRRMRGENVARPGGPQRFPKIEFGLHCQMARALNDRKRCVALIDMTNFDFGMEGLYHAPSADAEHDLLHQTDLGPASIEFCGYAAIRRTVERIVAVQQVELHPADRGLPDAELHDTTGQFEPDAQPATFRENNGLDRHRGRFVVGVEFLLRAAGVDNLTEIAFLIQQPDSDDGNIEIACCLQKIPGQNAQSARIERQGLT